MISIMKDYIKISFDVKGQQSSRYTKLSCFFLLMRNFVPFLQMIAMLLSSVEENRPAFLIKKFFFYSS